MPRLNKIKELQKWLNAKQCYMFKIYFTWEAANKTICILSESKDTAENIVKEKYPAATEITFLGSIDKMFC